MGLKYRDSKLFALGIRHTNYEFENPVSTNYSCNAEEVAWVLKPLVGH